MVRPLMLGCRISWRRWIEIAAVSAGTNKNDFYILSTTTANGSKGEGIAGTPRYIILNNALVDNVSKDIPEEVMHVVAPEMQAAVQQTVIRIQRPECWWWWWW